MRWSVEEYMAQIDINDLMKINMERNTIHDEV